MRYGDSVRKSVLARILPPKSEVMTKVANETGISMQTLIIWKKDALARGYSPEAEGENTKSFTSKEIFQIVVQAESLNETELGEFARSKGVFVEQIMNWRDVCENAALYQVIREKDQKIKELQGDVDRKNKALAELTALTVLKKKVNAIWGDPEAE